MRCLTAVLLSSALCVGSFGVALADGYVKNTDSSQRTIFLQCENDKGTQYKLAPGKGISVKAEFIRAGEGGCTVKMGSTGVNMYDGDSYFIVNGRFERQ